MRIHQNVGLAGMAMALVLATTPALAEPASAKATAVTITGVVSATPAAGANEVAVTVVTAPASANKSLAGGIKGTVIIVTLAAGVPVKRNGASVLMSELRAGDKVTITLTRRVGTAPPYKYVASKFLASSGAQYSMAITGVIAVAPAATPTSIMVFVRSYSTTRAYPSPNIRNTTIKVIPGSGATITRDGIAVPLSSLKLDDRVSLWITERTGGAPYTYVASRIIALSNSQYLPFTVEGVVASMPEASSSRIFLYVVSITDNGGYAAYDTLVKGHAIIVTLAPGGVVTRNGSSSTLGGLRLNDTATVRITDRTGTAEPYTYAASRVTAAGPA